MTIVLGSDSPIYDDLVEKLGDPKGVFAFEPFTLPEGEYPDPAEFRDIYLTYGVDPTYPPFLEFPATPVLLAACENASPAEVVTALEDFAQDPVSGHTEGSLPEEESATERILAASHAVESASKTDEMSFWASYYRVPAELPSPGTTAYFTPVWDEASEA